MVLDDGNYYTPAANREYMSVSMYKQFAGTYGKQSCEFAAMERLAGRWEDKPTTALLPAPKVPKDRERLLHRF